VDTPTAINRGFYNQVLFDRMPTMKNVQRWALIGMFILVVVVLLILCGWVWQNNIPLPIF